MSDYEPPDPFNAFYEVVEVRRKWHLVPDVKIYYISQTRKFKVVGGCKVKDTTSADYREIKIVLNDFEDKVFEIRRNKRGGTLYSKRRGFKFTFSN